MQTVGDLLVRCREAGPDPASPLGVSNPQATATPETTGGYLQNGIYYLVLTCVNPWGESVKNRVAVPVQASPPANAAIAAQNATEVKIDFTQGGNASSIQIICFPPPGATGFRVYLGQTPGAEIGYFEFDGVNSATITSFSGLIPGVPPLRATGMNPDTDGSFVSASTMYRWLNLGLRRAGRLSGGIKDFCGVPAVLNRGLYQIPGSWKGPINDKNQSAVFKTVTEWISFSDCWYDGWVMDFARRKDVFLHGQVPGLSGFVTWEQIASQIVFQMWPQPSRPGAYGQIVILPGDPPLGISDTEITFTYFDINAQFLDIGMVQIDNEIVAYNGIGLARDGFNWVLQNCVRGVGGTFPAAHFSGLWNMVELNIRLGGKRMPNEYSVGQSALPINVPAGWFDALEMFVLAEYKQAEQDMQTASQLLKEFDASIKQAVQASSEPPGVRQTGGTYRQVYPGGL